MSIMRNHKIELDFLRHQPPIRLTGGRLDRIGRECQEVVLTVPVRSLNEIEPFKYYDVIVRRHFPEWGKGLPLKIKILGNIALEPRNYIGAGFKEGRHEHDCGCEEHEGHNGMDVDGCEVEVIHEQVPAEIFDATLYGFNNAAMLDDVIQFDNSPYPFIRFYINDRGDWVIMPCQCMDRCRPRRLIVKRTEVVRQPFKAQTLMVNRTATPFVHPRVFRDSELWTQGNFGCRDFDDGCRGWML